MSSITRGVLCCALLVGLSLVVGTGAASAQKGGGKGGEPVNITTVDGVTLHGMFYQSTKPKAPTIIFLHNIGDRAINQKLYTSLAESLQPKFSVMLFDFRGHGKSKDVDPNLFWKYPPNIGCVPGAKAKRSSIEQGEFIKNPAYLPILVNDIAAVKAYLDRRNDASDCNTSNTILIGAETGATLGAIWLNSQWQLKRTVPNPANPLFPQEAPNPEGKDVIACIWLSPTAKFGSGPPVRLSQPLTVPVRVNACPTVFMYGDKDTTSATLSANLVKALKPSKEDSGRHKLTLYPVKGTQLRGISLVQKSLGIDERIQDYLSEIVEQKGNEWSKRDFNASMYLWKIGGTAMPAKDPTVDQKNLRFEDYRKFMSAP